MSEFFHLIGAESCPFEPIRKYFGNDVWSEMNDYEKNSYLSKYNNYQHMISLSEWSYLETSEINFSTFSFVLISFVSMQRNCQGIETTRFYAAQVCQ